MAKPPKYLASTYTDEHLILAVQPELATVGNETLRMAAGEAEAEINLAIGTWYALPLPVAVPILTTLATDIAIYRIYASRMFTSAPRSTEAPWADRYRAAVAMLMRLSTGGLTLIGIDGLPVPPAAGAGAAGAAWSSTMHYTPTMGEGDDRCFHVDPDKVEAERWRRAG